MKKTIFTLAVLPTLATAGYAQSIPNVTLYGTLTLGVTASHNGAASNAKVISVDSGTFSASALGIRGKEDIGAGISAVFVLEAGLNADTGAGKTISLVNTATAVAPGGLTTNGLFNRRATVGLDGKFGTISIGRDYTPVYYVSVETDPLRLGLWGNTQQAVQLSGTGTDRYARVSNAIFYVSPRIAGFQGRVVYSLGSESAGFSDIATPTSPPPKNGNTFGAISLSYTTAGLSVMGAYQRLRWPMVAGTGATTVFTGVNGIREDRDIGIKYNFGDFSIGGRFLDFVLPLPKSNSSAMALGGTIALGGGTVLAEVIRMRQDAPTGPEKEGISYSLSYTYSLSKRSTLYASFGGISNGSTASFTLVSNDTSISPGMVGGSVKAYSAGMRHTF